MTINKHGKRGLIRLIGQEPGTYVLITLDKNENLYNVTRGEGLHEALARIGLWRRIFSECCLRDYILNLPMTSRK